MIFIFFISAIISAADNTNELDWLKTQRIKLQNNLRRLNINKHWNEIKKLEDSSDSDDELTSSTNSIVNKEQKIKDQLSVIESKIADLEPTNKISENNGWHAWLFGNTLSTEELDKIKAKNKELQLEIAKTERHIAQILKNDDTKTKKD